MKRKKLAPTPSSAEVEAAIKGVLAFHQLGCALRRRHSRRARYGDHAMAEEGASIGQSRTMTTWARRFAVLYSSGDRPNELEELIALSRKHRFPLRKSHVIHLLQVPIAKERRRLQRKVIVERWSTTKLGRYVTAHYARRGGGGRRQEIPSDEVGLLSQLEGMCDTWQRFKNQVKEELLPASVRKRLQALAPFMDSLERSVGEEIMRRKRTRLSRRAGRTDTEDRARRVAAR